MTVQTRTDLSQFYIDKKPLQRLVAEHYAEAGITHDPTMTPERVQEMMRALGIRAEDTLFSWGIIAARDEE